MEIVQKVCGNVNFRNKYCSKIWVVEQLNVISYSVKICKTGLHKQWYLTYAKAGQFYGELMGFHFKALSLHWLAEVYPSISILQSLRTLPFIKFGFGNTGLGVGLNSYFVLGIGNTLFNMSFSISEPHSPKLKILCVY